MPKAGKGGGLGKGCRMGEMMSMANRASAPKADWESHPKGWAGSSGLGQRTASISTPAGVQPGCTRLCVCVVVCACVCVCVCV